MVERILKNSSTQKGRGNANGVVTEDSEETYIYSLDSVQYP